MRGRWWAPTRATIAPDDVVLALLIPDGDAAGDLGASILGLHRAGAASCEYVAKSAVPSEFDLVKALTSTNAQLGDYLSSAVSKSLEPNYAGLLIRDVIEDADASALSLFRSCVAKGVAPPLAASRVGAVYGVPSRDLGKYAVLATDPKANPVALTDAADRALLGYVSKLVSSEVGEIKEHVSKAPGDFVETDVRRDAGGRFTFETETKTVKTKPGHGQLVSTGDAPPLSRLARLRARLGLAGAAPQIVVAPQPKQRVRVDNKRTSTKRVVRQDTVQAKGKLKPTADVKLASAYVPLTSTNVKLTVADLELQARAYVAVRESLGQKTKELVQVKDFRALTPESAPTTDFMTKPYPNMEPMPEMWAPLIWHVSGKVGDAFRQDKRMVGNAFYDDPRRFRIKYLMDVAGSPEEHNMEGFAEDTTTPEFDNRRTEAKAAMREMPQGYVPPKVQHMPYQKYITESARDATRAEQGEIAATAGFEDQIEIDREVSEMYSVQDLYDGRDTIVYPQPQINPRTGKVDNNYSRPMPYVDEYTIAANYRFRGVDESGSETDKNTDWTLDPNQAYTLDETPLLFWDSKNKVLVRRWYIKPLDEEEEGKFAKALSASERVEFNQKHPHGAGGRFVNTLDAPSLVAPTATASRTTLEQLRLRLGLPAGEEKQEETTVMPKRRQRGSQSSSRRVQRMDAEPATTAFTASSVKLTASYQDMMPAEMTDLQRSDIALAIDEAITAPKKKLADLPTMSDQSSFKVLTERQWRKVMQLFGAGDADALDSVPGTSIPFRDMARTAILEGGLEDFADAREKLVWRAGTDLYGDKGDIRNEVLAGPFRMDKPKLIGKLVVKAFDDNEEIDYITIESMYNSDGASVGFLLGNSRPIAKQYLIQIDPEFDDLEDPNLELVNVGEFRAKNVLIESSGLMKPLVPARKGMHFAGIMNPRVQILRVVNPIVSVWRAEQQ